MLTPDFPRIPAERLELLNARLQGTSLPTVVEGSAAAPGPSMDLSARLLTHWRKNFDWRTIEDRVAALGATTLTRADGRRTVAIHSRATTATHRATRELPILLVHGWPDSPLRFLDLIPLLTAAGHDVVAPAMPGFWYSDEPDGPMSRELAASDMHEMMQELGYSRYAVHGGDWGSAVAQSLALQFPDAVAALHLTDIPFDLAFTIDKEVAPESEIAYLASLESFADSALYLTANTMAPNLIATALQDSPIGLGAWIGSLYEAWQQEPIGDEHIVANAALAYLTGTVRSSMRLYSEPAADWDDTGSWESPDSGDDADSWDSTGGSDGWNVETVQIPTGFALFPADIAIAPRTLADRYFAVERFSVMPRGGHFAALETPADLAKELLAFLSGRR